MARIKFGSLVTSIRGSVGGSTFQKNRYGYTIKNKSNQVSPRNVSQRRRQARFYSAMQKWISLSNAQRQQWGNYAITYPVQSINNPDSYLNGYNYFCQYHLYLSMINQQSILSDPNGTRFQITTDQQGLVLSGGDLNFFVAGSYNITDFYVIIELTNVLPDSHSFVQQTPYFIDSYDRSVSTNQNIQTAYYNKYQITPQQGQRVGAKIVYVNKFAGQLAVYNRRIFTIQ